MSGEIPRPAPKPHTRASPVSQWRIEPRILIADDDEESFVLLSHALKKTGASEQLEWISDGEQLIERLGGVVRNGGPLPMLLVLDLKMPRVNGFEVLVWLRENIPAERWPVVVVVSSSGRAEDMTKALQLGAVMYFEKFPTGEKFSVVYQLARKRMNPDGLITT